MNEPRFSYGFEDKTEKLASGALEVVHSLAADKASGTSGLEVSSEARGNPKQTAQLLSLELGPEFKGKCKGGLERLRTGCALQPGASVRAFQ